MFSRLNLNSSFLPSPEFNNQRIFTSPKQVLNYFSFRPTPLFKNFVFYP